MRRTTVALDTKMTGNFRTKPKTLALAERIIGLVQTLGPGHQEIKGQMTFAGKRKFLWMWTYGHTADGTLYVTVCLDRKIDSPNFQYVKQVSPNRWNHHVVVRSFEQIDSRWFNELIEAGHVFSGN
jgi:hypothetical protein